MGSTTGVWLELEVGWWRLRSSLPSSLTSLKTALSSFLQHHDLKDIATAPRGHEKLSVTKARELSKSWNLQNTNTPRRDLRNEMPPDAPRDTVPYFIPYSSFYPFCFSYCLYLGFTPSFLGTGRVIFGLGKLMMNMRNMAGRTGVPEGVNTCWELARPISRGKHICRFKNDGFLC